MTKSHLLKYRYTIGSLRLLILFVCIVSPQRASGDDVPLTSQVSEQVLEAFLSPGEFPDRLVTYTLKGDAAFYAMDISLSAKEPFAVFQPTRVVWPDIAGLPVKLKSAPVHLKTVSANATDEQLDEGFSIELGIAPQGQAFAPVPHFVAEPVRVVIRSNRGETLLEWTRNQTSAACIPHPHKKGAPNCILDNIGREVEAIALSPDGMRLAVALSGLRPRLELYQTTSPPKRLWQVLLPRNSGGAQETSFSADGKWVVVLTGKGRMHRFDAYSGGNHLHIPSKGRSARAIPPGNIIAVADDSGEVKMWYLADGTIAWRLPPSRSRSGVDTIATSGDGSRFALMTYQNNQTTIRIFEFQNRIMLRQFIIDNLGVTDIALNDKGNRLFVSHESNGLLVADTEKTAQPKPLQKKGTLLCTGRLAWHHDKETLSCATATGVLIITETGKVVRHLTTPETTDTWLVTASTEGGLVAAAGGGKLLIWWLKNRESHENSRHRK